MIDFEAIADLDAPYEPWQPKVGDRVRITGAIAECRVVWPNLFPGYDEPTGHPHPQVEVGKTGSVYAIWDPDKNLINKTHLIAVMFDEACWDCHSVGGNYAACELDPIPEAVS